MHAIMWRALCRTATPVVPKQSPCFMKALMPRPFTMRSQPPRARTSRLSLAAGGCPPPAPDAKLTLKTSTISSGAAVLSATGRKGGAPKKVNQDSFLAEAALLAPGSTVATVIGVFDGHGKDGHHASGFVKGALFSALHLCIQQAVQPLLPSPAASADCADVGNLGTASALASEPTQLPPEFPHLAACELSPEHVRAALAGSFEAAANGLRAGHEARQLNAAHSGSTACVCVVTENSVVAAWAGDSRAVMGRAEGGSYSATQLTRDHKPNNLSEMARIMAAGGLVARGLDRQGRPSGPFRVMHRSAAGSQAAPAPGLAVARAFGDLHLASAGVIPTPELVVFLRGASAGSAAAGGRPCSQELLVVASDGLWDLLSNDQAVAMAVGAGCPEAGAEALMAEAKARWAAARGDMVRDDITMAVAYL